jgi:redox-sensing transcriptional repressor
VIQPRPRTIPEATVARLAVYLRVLTPLADGGRITVSSGELAEAAGVNPAGLRKDLSHLGPCGVRGVGYEVGTLRDRIARVLGVERSRACVLVGIGNLGSALADYAGFGTRGFEFVGLFDAAPSRIGQRIGGLTVRPIADLEDVVAVIADSIQADAPLGVVERLTAVGRAYGTRAADSLSADLPELIRTDWLRGDTIVGTFLQVEGAVAAADSIAEEGDTARTELETLTAIGSARSLYRMDSSNDENGAQAVNYLVATRIALRFEGGEVASVETVGPVEGVHLEPVRAARAEDEATGEAAPPAAEPQGGTSGPGGSR